MKKLIALLCCLLLPVSFALAQDEAPTGLSYEPSEFTMAAVGCKMYIPADMTGYDSDLASYDMGFRLNLEDADKGFYLDVSVECGRDMGLMDFAKFYAERIGYEAPTEDEINGFPVARMLKADDPSVTAILIGMPGADSYDSYYYSLIFSCDNDGASSLMHEILSTITTY